MATVYINIDLFSARGPRFSGIMPELVTVAPTAASVIPITGLAFANGESATFPFFVTNYAAGSVTMTASWYSRTGAVTGNVALQYGFAAVADNDATSMEAKTAANVFNTLDVAANTTAKGPRFTTLTIPSGQAALGGLTNGEWATLVMSRVTPGAGTDMAGDAIVFGLTVSYTSL